MFRMELPKHGGNASPRNWFRAAGAQRPPFGVVMRLAIWQSFVVKERSALERKTTVLEAKGDY